VSIRGVKVVPLLTGQPNRLTGKSDWSAGDPEDRRKKGGSGQMRKKPSEEYRTRRDLSLGNALEGANEHPKQSPPQQTKPEEKKN